MKHQKNQTNLSSQSYLKGWQIATHNFDCLLKKQAATKKASV